MNDMPHTVEVVDDLLIVLDQDGNGYDYHELRGLARAKHQLRTWQRDYTFDYAAATRAVSDFFAREPTRPSTQQPNAELRAVDLRVEQIARELLGIPTLTERGSDALDFHEVSVHQIKLALRVAYEAGRNALR
jgi:hypothetical protein